MKIRIEIVSQNFCLSGYFIRHKPVRRVHFKKLASACTATHRTAFIMRALRVAARKSAARYGAPIAHQHNARGWSS